MNRKPQVGDVVLYSDGCWYRVNRVIQPTYSHQNDWYELVTIQTPRRYHIAARLPCSPVGQAVNVLRTDSQPFWN